jgi:hypothetical protein
MNIFAARSTTGRELRSPFDHLVTPNPEDYPAR